MTQNQGRSRDDMLRLIAEAFCGVAPDQGPLEPATLLLGKGAAVDSVALVTLLVAVEQGLGGVDLSASFMEHTDDPEDENPFRSAGSLAELLVALTRAAA